MVTGAMSLNVRLLTDMSAPRTTFACCTAALAEKNTSQAAPGTTPPEEVPLAFVAQLLEDELDTAIEARFPGIWPPSQYALVRGVAPPKLI